MTQFFLYIHTRPDGTPFYVGKGIKRRTVNFNARSAMHKNIVAKYGRQNIGVFAFACESEIDAFASEIHTIAQFRHEGYALANFTNGGEGTSGYQMTDATKAKVSKVHLGKKLSNETKAKMSAARKGVKKKPFTAEHIAKIVAALAGKVQKPRSVEHCANLSAALKGRKGPLASAETKAKMSAIRLGRLFTDQHKANIALAQLGGTRGPQSAEHKAKLLESNAKSRLLRNQAKSELKCASLDGLKHFEEKNAILRGEAEIA